MKATEKWLITNKGFSFTDCSEILEVRRQWINIFTALKEKKKKKQLSNKNLIYSKNMKNFFNISSNVRNMRKKKHFNEKLGFITISPLKAVKHFNKGKYMDNYKRKHYFNNGSLVYFLFSTWSKKLKYYLKYINLKTRIIVTLYF